MKLKKRSRIRRLKVHANVKLTIALLVNSDYSSNLELRLMTVFFMDEYFITSITTIDIFLKGHFLLCCLPFNNVPSCSLASWVINTHHLIISKVLTIDIC